MGRYIGWRGNFICGFILLVFPLAAGAAADKRDENEGRVISGMSIVGNDETPKELYIVPWKSHEAGKETGFSSTILKQDLSPLDKDDFIRRLGFSRDEGSK